ncbi:MAG: DUF3783 domain-containing protein [Solobacterium sp.]|nr:DUF3783 domain-containing protein [Solobacterium sp.]
MEKILLYGLDDQSAEMIGNAGKQLGIAVCRIGDSALFHKVADLFEAGFDQDTQTRAFDNEYMIMQEMDSGKLYALLDELEKQQYEFEGIKVMRTDTNENWTLFQLLQETGKEHRIQKKVIILREMLMSCNTLDLSVLPQGEKESFRQVLMDAFVLYQSGTYTDKELDECIHQLSDSLKKIRKLYS